MKKLINQISASAICVLSCALMVSCDGDYDLSKKFNTDISVGKNFEVPVGKTVNIPLSRIIKPSSELSVNSNGTYELVSGSKFSNEIKKIEEIKINDFSAYFNDVNINLNSGSSEEAVTIKTSISNTTNYQVDTKLPSEIEKINEVTVKTTDNHNVNTTLRVSTENIPKGIKSIKLKNIRIEFPEIFNLKDFDSNIVNIKDFTLQPGQSSISEIITISGISIPDSEQNKYIKGETGNKSFVMTDDVTIYADVEIEAYPSLIDKPILTIKFDYSVPQTKIQSIGGYINPDVKISEIISLNDISTIITDNRNNFEPELIAFKFDINNPTGLTIDGDFQISQSYKNSGPGKNVNINIENIKANTTSEFIISNRQIDNLPTNTANIVNSDLISLLNNIPDSYKIESTDIKAYSKNNSELFTLNQRYSISGDYEINIPFIFNKFELYYTDSIENLLDDLKDVADLTNHIIVKGNAVSTIPLELAVEAKLYDINGNELTQLILDLNKCIIKPSLNGLETETQIEISIIEPEGSTQLEDLEKIVYTIIAPDMGSTGINLKSTQSLTIKDIKAKIPNGITTTL